MNKLTPLKMKLVAALVFEHDMQTAALSVGVSRVRYGIRRLCLVCGFCSSGPRFVPDFLPTPPRGDAVVLH